VGTAGEAELFDVWLTDFVAPADVLRRLRDSTPADLGPVGGRFVQDPAASLSAACTAAVYSVLLPGAAGDPDIASGLRAIAGQHEITVQHKGKARTYDPGFELLEPPVVQDSDGDAVVRLVLRLGAQGALRPDALVAAALEYSGPEAVNLVVTRLGLLEQRDGAYRDPLE
jgi:hypothetical protein